MWNHWKIFKINKKVWKRVEIHNKHTRLKIVCCSNAFALVRNLNCLCVKRRYYYLCKRETQNCRHVYIFSKFLFTVSDVRAREGVGGGGSEGERAMSADFERGVGLAQKCWRHLLRSNVFVKNVETTFRRRVTPVCLKILFLFQISDYVVRNSQIYLNVKCFREKVKLLVFLAVEKRSHCCCVFSCSVDQFWIRLMLIQKDNPYL